MDVYQHVDSGENTSFVGNNSVLIEDLFKISIRIKNVSEDFFNVDEEAAMAAMNHHIYHYNWLVKSILWRLPYRKIVELLSNYPPYEKSNKKLVHFSYRHPRAYAISAQVVRPLLLSAMWVRNKLK